MSIQKSTLRRHRERKRERETDKQTDRQRSLLVLLRALSMPLATGGTDHPEQRLAVSLLLLLLLLSCQDQYLQEWEWLEAGVLECTPSL